MAFKQRSSDYVIEYAGRPVKGIKRSFATACKKAGLEGVSPHTLKHTCISLMAEAGIDNRLISEYTATSLETVDRIYRHVNPEALRGVADAMEGALDGVY